MRPFEADFTFGGPVWAVYRRLAAVDRFGKAIGNPVLISEGFQAVGLPGGQLWGQISSFWLKFLSLVFNQSVNPAIRSN